MRLFYVYQCPIKTKEYLAPEKGPVEGWNMLYKYIFKQDQNVSVTGAKNWHQE